MTCWGEVKKLGIQMEQGVFALVGTAAGGTFSLEDLYQDVDAVNVYTLAKRNSDSTALSALKRTIVIRVLLIDLINLLRTDLVLQIKSLQ